MANVSTQSEQSTLIPMFPNFALVSEYMKAELDTFCSTLNDGISEFSFANIFIHREENKYKISKLSSTSDSYALLGEGPGVEEIFFSVLGKMPSLKQLNTLFEIGQKWKFMPESLFISEKENLIDLGYKVEEDRDNEDYLYNRVDLEFLSGKDFHKKKNLCNAFEKTYSPIVKDMTAMELVDAMSVLEGWNDTRPSDEENDYLSCVEAIKYYEFLEFFGVIIYVENKPVGFSIGGHIKNKKTFCVHYEKVLPNYKGGYQYLNRATVAALPQDILVINREQDLGDEGLRQAKLTYRPCGMIKKYKVMK